MQLPTISQYADSIGNPYGLLRTLGEFEAERDLYGRVRFRSGNNSAVFRVTSPAGETMLKCYIKHPRYAEQVYGYISSCPDDQLLTRAELLQRELFVYDAFGNGDYCDIVCGSWIDGDSLAVEIRRAARESGRERFRELSEMFDAMALELISKEWAHGDLKPENIIVAGNGSLKLIDYDAMFIPAMAGKPAVEVGTPAYRHPLRDERIYDKSIDDYPIAIISASLRALALDISLYEKYHNGDNIIIDPHEIFAGISDAYDEIISLFAGQGDHRSYRLARLLESPSPDIAGLREALRGGMSGEIHGFPAQPVLIERNGLWGYSDEDGRVTIAPIYEEATEFSEGMAVVKLDGRVQVIDTAGNVLIGDGFDRIKPFSCGLAAAKTGGKWGFIDTCGNFVVEPSFEAASSMREDMAAVKFSGKWGYVDRNGNMAIAPRFDHATGFRDARASVAVGDMMLVIDRNGNVTDGD